MKNFTQHGTTTVFEHCVSVAKFSLLMAYYLERTMKIKVDRDSLVRAALLHDYFLYDWHDKTIPGHNIHGFTHPRTAMLNADRDFGLNAVEKDIISKHMFPLTFMPPRYRESVLVTAGIFLNITQTIPDNTFCNLSFSRCLPEILTLWIFDYKRPVLDLCLC